jgi:hypothetical protein
MKLNATLVLVAMSVVVAASKHYVPFICAQSSSVFARILASGVKVSSQAFQQMQELLDGHTSPVYA